MISGLDISYEISYGFIFVGSIRSRNDREDNKKDEHYLWKCTYVRALKYSLSISSKRSFSTNSEGYGYGGTSEKSS